MVRVSTSATTSSKVVTKVPEVEAPETKLNASVGSTESVLTNALDQLREISTQLAAIIEEQVEDPAYQDGKAVLADRVIDWTADIFSISEDIRFYLNPPVPDSKEE